MLHALYGKHKLILQKEWFQRDVLQVAPELLGKKLCRQFSDGRIVKVAITEVEAYDGQEDKACHAHRGMTDRNAIMFEPGGCWYVYLCYGVHWLLNITTGEKDYPAAVLIRGIDDCNGPGRLTKHLQVDGLFKNSVADKKSLLWIEDAGPVPEHEIIRSARIGVDYAGEKWASKPYRFNWIKV